jgi:hypothetical protein
MPRIAITDNQRRALRAWYRCQGPSTRQKDVINWFEREYGHRIRQSTVSDSLSERYSYLDSAPNTSATDRTRQRQAQWPILESILFDWQQLLESRGSDVPGDILIEKARSIWPQIPDYVNLPLPEFSSGWLTNFKRRHNIKLHRHQGEAGSVPPQTEDEMRAIRTLCGEYTEENIFNMDETGLYWRQGPSAGLSTRARPGRKKDKTRISIVCCCNFDGSQRFALWAIGKAARPHALRGVNLEALDIQWRSNSKAWMNTDIMKGWLKAFYQWIGLRSILLLMDNHSAHIKGVDEQPPPPNIRIQWLPANSTSLYQPLDQGVISQFKRYYKKQWIRFMISCYEVGSDPVRQVNLYYALCWASQAWFDDLRSDAVYRCFRRARIQPIQEPINLPEPQQRPQQELEELYEVVQQAGQIQDAMSLESFLNPIGENEEPGETDFDLAEAIVRYSQVVAVVEDEEDEEVPMQIPTTAQAEQALESLLLYQAHQDKTTAEEMKTLRRLFNRAKAQRSEQAVQVTLDNWLT